MQKIANILLIENSTAGNLPKLFKAQQVEIRHKADTILLGADGHVSRGKHPSEVFWYGGQKNDMRNITNIMISSDDGNVLLDGELNITYGSPKDTDKGLYFFVL